MTTIEESIKRLDNLNKMLNRSFMPLRILETPELVLLRRNFEMLNKLLKPWQDFNKMLEPFNREIKMLRLGEVSKMIQNLQYDRLIKIAPTISKETDRTITILSKRIKALEEENTELKNQLELERRKRKKAPYDHYK